LQPLTQARLMDNNVVRGAITGLWAWMAYGILELALSVAIPRFWSNESELLPWQWRLLGLLFGVYAVAGVVSGAVGGAWLARKGRSRSKEEHRNLACAILAFAFAMNLGTAWPLARSENVALMMAAALGAAFCTTFVSEAFRRRTAFLASPGILSLLLLIGPWVSREAFLRSSGLVKLGLSWLSIAGVLGIAALWHRISATKHERKAWGTVAGAVIVGVLGFGIRPSGTAALAAESAMATKPNILLIIMDTVRADHLSVYGYERNTTPNLIEFAREATVYERLMACSGFTLPTHGSIFTGLYPSWHGADISTEHPYPGNPLPPRTRTMASMLRDAGYWTAEAVANYGFLGPATGLTQGFERKEIKAAVHFSDSNRPFYLREGARKILSLVVNTADFRQLRLRATDIDRQAFALLEEARNRRRPFFVFLNYMDAHSPYLPPLPFRDRFSAGDRNLNPINPQTSETVYDVNAGRRVLNPREKRDLKSQYDAGIAYIDAAIGELLTRLRELALYDNTLVIISADHGEAFGEHGLMGHGTSSVYQDQVHVPLLVKYPGQHAGSRSDALVSQVDFLPTVLELAGITAPAGLQGQGLRSLRNADSGAILAQAVALRQQGAKSPMRGIRRAIFSGRWKLIVWTDGDPELYDVAADPGELKNLYRPGDARAAALMAGMKTWVASMPRTNSSGSAKPMDKSTLEKLRSLGYAQ
jgi:arylsulfatase A-like enzyme